MRSYISDPKTRFLHFKPQEIGRACMVVSYLIQREARRVRDERFVPRVEKEGKKIFSEMERSISGNFGRDKARR